MCLDSFRPDYASRSNKESVEDARKRKTQQLSGYCQCKLLAKRLVETIDSAHERGNAYDSITIYNDGVTAKGLAHNTRLSSA